MTLDLGRASGREILAHLLELTPEPPCTDAEHLLTAFASIDAARSEVIGSLVPPIAIADDDRPLLVELERRHALWQDALARALHAVGGQRCGATHLRAYAQPG